MAKAFDATLNTLLDERAADWANFLAARVGVPPGEFTVLDTDLSTTLQADRLFRIDGPSPAVLHLELESGGRLGIPGELLRYNVAAWGVAQLPVHSVLVLLRPKATATDLTGEFRLAGVTGHPYLTFRYTVVRVWQESIDDLLKAGLGLAPLALLTNEAAADLPAAFERFRDRLRADAVTGKLEKVLFGSSFVLCGLRYEDERIAELYQTMSLTLEDSTTYQWILKKGVAQGALETMRATVLRLGAKRFGAATESTQIAVNAITDPTRLQRMAERVLDAASWDDILATP
jgi:hypothetical protein